MVHISFRKNFFSFTLSFGVRRSMYDFLHATPLGGMAEASACPKFFSLVVSVTRGWAVGTRGKGEWKWKWPTTGVLPL